MSQHFTRFTALTGSNCHHALCYPSQNIPFRHMTVTVATRAQQLSSRSALKKVSRNGRYLERANTTNGEQNPQNRTARDRGERDTNGAFLAFSHGPLANPGPQCNGRDKLVSIFLRPVFFSTYPPSYWPNELKGSRDSCHVALLLFQFSANPAHWVAPIMSRFQGNLFYCHTVCQLYATDFFLHQSIR